MTLDQLTDRERFWLSWIQPGAKALRMIDQLIEALACADRTIEEKIEVHEAFLVRVRHLEEDNAGLREELAACQYRIDSLQDALDGHQ